MAKLADITTPLRAHIIAKTYKSWLGKKTKVLDVGCGTGVVGDELSKSLGIKISGCDTDKYIIRKIPFKKMESAKHLPYEPHSFDSVMFNDVLHHTDYKTQKELIVDSTRLAKSVLVFELKPTFIGRALDFLLNKIHNPNMEIPFTYRKKGEWEKLFRSLNLDFESKKVVSPFFYPFSHIAFRLSKKS